MIPASPLFLTLQKTFLLTRAGVFLSLITFPASAQQSQNPSPMVEHTRAHPRLEKQTPPGRRESLEMGTLFIPEKLKSRKTIPLWFFFHGGAWLPEVAASQRGMAVVTIQVGAGSGVYVQAFSDDAKFVRLIDEAEKKLGVKFAPIALGGWSAGCGAIRQILKSPQSYARVQRVLCIDGMHTGYVDGKPGPQESQLEIENLQLWLPLARDAVTGKKEFVLTHSEIFPGTFASTTETADWLLRELNLTRQPVSKWGPMKTQQLSEARKGKFLCVGFAGNSAPDHVDQLHSLPDYLKWFK